MDATGPDSSPGSQFVLKSLLPQLPPLLPFTPPQNFEWAPLQFDPTTGVVLPHPNYSEEYFEHLAAQFAPPPPSPAPSSPAPDTQIFYHTPSRFGFSPTLLGHDSITYGYESSTKKVLKSSYSDRSPSKLQPPRQLFQTPPPSPMNPRTLKTNLSPVPPPLSEPQESERIQTKKRSHSDASASPSPPTTDDIAAEMQSPTKRPHTSMILDHSTIDLTEISAHENDQAPNTSILLDGSVEMDTGREFQPMNPEQLKTDNSAETESTQLFQVPSSAPTATVSRHPSGTFTSQVLPKVLTQAVYDDNAFLAKVSSHRLKTSQGPAGIPLTPSTSSMETSLLNSAKNRLQRQNSRSRDTPASQMRSISQIPFYAKQQQQPESQNADGGYPGSSQQSQSMSRHVSLDRDGFQKLQMSVHYSLIGGGGDDEEDYEDGGDRGILEFDPDIVTHDDDDDDNGAHYSDSAMRFQDFDPNVGGYAMSGDYGHDDDFRIASQPPQRSMRNYQMGQQYQMWNAIEDEDPAPNFYSASLPLDDDDGFYSRPGNKRTLNDSIEEIDSSQEAPQMSMLPLIEETEDLDRNIAAMLRRPPKAVISSKYQLGGASIYMQSPASTPLYTQTTSDPRARFLPANSTSPVPSGAPSQTPTPATGRPLSSSFAFLPVTGAPPAVKSLGSALAFKSSKRTVASKPKAPKKSAVKMANNQAVMEIEDDDDGDGVDQSVMKEGSTMDSSHEMIEEFPASEPKMKSYSPYEMVAKASSAVFRAPGSLTSSSARPSEDHQDDPASNPRSRIIPRSPASAAPVSRTGTIVSPKPTLEWLSSIAPPVIPTNSQLSRASVSLQPSAPKGANLIIEVLLVGESYGNYTSVLGYLLSDLLNRQPDLFEDVSPNPPLVHLVLNLASSILVPGLLVSPEIYSSFEYPKEVVGLLWQSHTKADKSPIVASSVVLFSEKTNLVHQDILKEIPNASHLDRLRTAVSTPAAKSSSWSSFSSNLAKGSLHQQQHGSNPMPQGHHSLLQQHPPHGLASSEPQLPAFTLPQSAAAAAAAASSSSSSGAPHFATVPAHIHISSSNRPGMGPRHFVSPLAFNGFPGGVRSLEIVVLAMFEVKLPRASPKTNDAAAGGDASNSGLKLKDFKLNFSKAVSLAEASTRQKMHLLHQRCSLAFSIPKLKQCRLQNQGQGISRSSSNSSSSSSSPPNPSNTIIRALALSLSTKSLVWVNMGPSEQVMALQPGHIVRIEGKFEGAKSRPSLGLSSLAKDALEFLGYSTLDCSHSINMEGHGRLHKSTRYAASAFFPSSQDSNDDGDNPLGDNINEEASNAMDVVQTDRITSTSSMAASLKPPPSVSIPIISLTSSISSAKNTASSSSSSSSSSSTNISRSFSIVSSRDADDRLLRLTTNFASSSNTPLGRVSLLANISSPPTLNTSSHQRTITCSMTIANASSSDNSQFTLSLPARPFSNVTIKGPIFFDMLLQDSPHSFQVDGFTRATVLVPGLLNSRANRHLTRSLCTSGALSQLEVSLNDFIQFKISGQNTIQQVTFKSLILPQSSPLVTPTLIANPTLYAHIQCPNHGRLHRQQDLVVLPMTFKFETFAPHPAPDLNAFCRTCLGFVTPVLIHC